MSNFYLRQFSWGLAGLALIGFVVLAAVGISRLLLRSNESKDIDLAGQTIVGASLVLLITIAWNFIAPVNAVLFWSLQGFGVSLLVNSFQGRRLGPLNLPIYIAILIATAVALRCILDGLSLQAQIDGYHYTMVNWMHSTRTPPGLANLDGRLGFNSSNLVVAAFLSSSPLGELALPFFNYLLLFALSFSSSRAICSNFLAFNTSPRKASDVYLAALIIPIVAYAFSIRGLFPPSSLSSDLPSLLIQLYTVYILFRVFESDTSSECGLWLAFFALAATLSVVIKLSAVAFYLGSFGYFLVFAWWRRALLISLVNYYRLWFCTFSLILLWLIRGAIFSGYILFPSLAMPLPVDWRVPYEFGSQLNSLIEHWGIMRYWQFFDSFASLQGFVSGQPLLFAVPALLLAIGVFSLIRRSISCRSYRCLLLTVLSSTFGSLVVWSASAPDPRFVLSLVWIWGLLAFQALAQDLDPSILLSSLIVITLFCGPVQRVIVEVVMFDRPVLFAAREAFWRTPPGPSGIFRFPVPTLRHLKTCGGVDTYTADYAWKAPLSTTDMHEPSSCLQYRDAHNNLAGFRIVQGCKCLS